MDHESVTNIVTKNHTIPYGVGVVPNPYVSQQKEWVRRHLNAAKIKTITDKIESLFEPRFITPPETAECIEAIIRMTDSLKVLEVGTHTGFTSLHILRALIGKEGARFLTIDARPVHDAQWFSRWYPTVEFIEGWTPDIFKHPTILSAEPFDLVFVDSNHTEEHTAKEVEELWKITQSRTIFLFHDVPEWQQPTNPNPAPVRRWLFEQVALGRFQGGVLPTCEQLDCLDMWGSGYPKQCNPHLGIFVRK